MKGLVHWLVHSVCQLCGDPVNILEASSKQDELPAISQERKLQQFYKANFNHQHYNGWGKSTGARIVIFAQQAV